MHCIRSEVDQGQTKRIGLSRHGGGKIDKRWDEQQSGDIIREKNFENDKRGPVYRHWNI